MSREPGNRFFSYLDFSCAVTTSIDGLPMISPGDVDYRATTAVPAQHAATRPDQTPSAEDRRTNIESSGLHPDPSAKTARIGVPTEIRSPSPQCRRKFLWWIVGVVALVAVWAVVQLCSNGSPTWQTGIGPGPPK